MPPRELAQGSGSGRVRQLPHLSGDLLREKETLRLQERALQREGEPSWVAFPDQSDSQKTTIKMLDQKDESRKHETEGEPSKARFDARARSQEREF
jgi:hypothetical protein